MTAPAPLQVAHRASGAGGLCVAPAEGGPTALSQFPLEDLVAEVEARAACSPDLGLSQQICPRCSTTQSEVFGEYSRVERRFVCQACRLRLTESRYEIELDRFQSQRWRARRERRRLAELRREAQ